ARPPAAARRTPHPHARVRVVFDSGAPDRATPERSDRYAKGVHPSVLGRSGSPETSQEVARTFGDYDQKTQYRGPGEYLVDHTATTFVVQDGKLVLLFSPEKVEATDKVVADLRALF
ncbi:MAG: SCO family protein, partial [Thermus sp.]